MEELIKFCFNNGNKEFIGTTRCGTIWTNGEKNIDYLLIKRL